MKKIITVAVVEDTDEIRQHLDLILNQAPDFNLVGSYSNAEEAIIFLEKSAPDVVLTDIGLPGLDGIQLVTRLKQKLPYTEFMMYTIFNQEDKVFEALKAGATGYILKTDGETKILGVLRDLYDGGSPMSSSIARKVTKFFRREKQDSRLAALSDRENELLALLANGLLYKEIGSKLNITVGTVKQHVHRIYQKLHVKNRGEASKLYYGK